MEKGTWEHVHTSSQLLDRCHNTNTQTLHTSLKAKRCHHRTNVFLNTTHCRQNESCLLRGSVSWIDFSLEWRRVLKMTARSRNQAEVARKHLVVASGSVCSERVYLTRSDICQFCFFWVQETSEKCLWNKRSPLCSRVAWSVTHSFTITSPLNVLH